MFEGKSVTVIFPAFNEEEYVAQAVKEFLSTGVVDELVVVDNGSTDQTAAKAALAGARVVAEQRRGYGFALIRGYKSAKGDIIVSAEPDGTFDPADLVPMLSLAKDYDVVFGTRTAKGFIGEGAKMGWFLRHGNRIVAALLGLLHGGPRLTDVGCTMKAMNRRAVEAVLPSLRTGGSHFSPELIIASIRSGLRCIEMPVHYRKRVGRSKITSDFRKSLVLGIRMIGLIVGFRFRDFRPAWRRA